MPIVIRQENIPPEIMVKHEGVTVFRTYEEFDFDYPEDIRPIENLFTTYPGEDQDDSACFDIRILPESTGREAEISDIGVQRDILRQAIDNGHLDSVGLRDFMVDVEIRSKKETGETDTMSELQMKVEDMHSKIPLIIAGLSTRSLLDGKVPTWDHNSRKSLDISCQFVVVNI